MEAVQETAQEEFANKDKLLIKMHDERSKNLAKVCISIFYICLTGQTIQRAIRVQGATNGSGPIVGASPKGQNYRS